MDDELGPEESYKCKIVKLSKQQLRYIFSNSIMALSRYITSHYDMNNFSRQRYSMVH